jgi:hypothetical protein
MTVVAFQEFGYGRAQHLSVGENWMLQACKKSLLEIVLGICARAALANKLRKTVALANNNFKQMLVVFKTHLKTSLLLPLSFLIS